MCSCEDVSDGVDFAAVFSDYSSLVVSWDADRNCFASSFFLDVYSSEVGWYEVVDECAKIIVVLLDLDILA